MNTIQISKLAGQNGIGVYESFSKKIRELYAQDFGAAFSWSGEDVIDFFLDVLTDCNYHQERKVIEVALKNFEDERTES
jgi:hypothetical protein